ncbi:DapH/DapD/GlmU-related protein [Amphritea pacifica]|uniref:DapH/DapD/GlmU-related protein n=1 Tax=Amphritea pacifica TaxID=2811233 RepID=UPI0019664FDB|nr:DapH/DapD/GlmU-related protein [Amphritea pacifica]MBN1005322.1 hypothetical protein [Amphritea pacifica]
MLESYGLLGFFRLFINVVLTRIFYSKSRLVRFPFRVRGGKYIDFGVGLTTGVNCRMDAFPVHNKACLFFGENVQINDFVHIGAIDSVRIGNDVLIASKVFISDHNHGFYGLDGEHTDPDIKPLVRRLSSSPVSIEDNVWIGESVSILPGVTIGKGSIIGANSVVTRNIDAYTIAVGVPAKVVKKFDFASKKWVSA